ncbi:MAG TPA: TetR/AcrR family transcriptional regulator [Ramlibacter sp.]|jgi:TetR/AcrR family transcriptional repressor of nem operon|nr:TetR/AcrR family transcriptional regulator [Ramlibacter sp.]
MRDCAAGRNGRRDGLAPPRWTSHPQGRKRPITGGRPQSERAAQDHARILAAAARLFRLHGFAGAGMADLVREAGLRPGDFYQHFSSKDELKVLAVASAAEHALAHWQAIIAQHPAQPLAGWLDAYLSLEHRDDPGSGCPLAALAGDAAHERAAVKGAMGAVARLLFAQLAALGPAADERLQRRRAAATLAGMVGALMLSRAIPDDEFSAEVLHAVRESLTDPGSGRGVPP